MTEVPLWRPQKIISGGQTGADQGGLLAAEALVLHPVNTSPILAR